MSIDYKFIRPTAIIDNAGTFTRATTGTYIDAAGVVQTAAIDELRWDYSGGVFNGLLLEAAATNGLLYANDFSNAAWIKRGTAAVAQNLTGPDGDPNTAWTFSGIDTAVDGDVYQIIILADGAISPSVWLKQITAAGVVFIVNAQNANQGKWSVDLSLLSTDFERITKEHPAVTVISEFTQVTSCGLHFHSTPLANISIGVFGSQLEQGPDATSYIPTTAAPVTRAADINTAMLLSDVPETDATAWDSVTNFVVGNTCLFAHKIYECLINNSNSQPDLNTGGLTPKWLDTGYDNRWKMFDQKVGSQTSQTDIIRVALTPGLIDSIALLDLDAVAVDIVMNDPTEGIVYRESIDLINKTFIIDAYTYFFEPVITAKSVVLSGIPAYGSATISISISKPASTAKDGTLVIGMQKEIGGTKYNPEVGITSWSKKTYDEFGLAGITRRPFSKRMSCEVLVPNSLVDDVFDSLAEHESILVVWVGSSNFNCMIIYGFYKSFSIVIPYPTYSLCRLEIEGLSQ